MTSKVLRVLCQAPCQESVKGSRKRRKIVPDDNIEINRMSRRMAPHVLNLGSRWRWANFTLRQFYPQKKTPVPTEQEVGWAPAPVWTFWRTENSFCPTGFRNPDRQPVDYSLYHLSYPRAGLDVLENRKFSLPYRVSKPDRQPVD